MPPSPPPIHTTLPSADPDKGSPTSPVDEPTAETALVDRGLGTIGEKQSKWYSYLVTREFWTVLAVGQILALCTTSTNTFTTFLADSHTNIPIFQTFFTYALLAIIWTAVFVVQEQPKKWLATASSFSVSVSRRSDSWWKLDISIGLMWRYMILAFLDVQGNYFTVRAYQHTNILSAQLFNFWSIVCVVGVSFFLLGVRYKPFQVIGILVCCSGMGILLASDYVTGDTGAPGKDMIRGDLFALLGATCYGLTNVFEEWMVSKRPIYEVLSFLGLFGAIINGTQAAIFDHKAIERAEWGGQAIGYMTGYTLSLTLFYTLAPLLLRMGSAAFFDMSLLTANFWVVIVGTRLFGLKVHFLYPIAFAFILLGLTAYFLSGKGDSDKPWLGEGQEDGVDGVGTARRRALDQARRRREDLENA